MPKAKPLSKEDILRAMRLSKSNMGAARYLNVSYIHYKKWAKLYTDETTGKTLFEIHKNLGAKGVPKTLSGRKYPTSQYKAQDIIDGKVDVSRFKPDVIKQRLISEGIIEEKCALCGFSERRVLDYQAPLILRFKNGQKFDYSLNNIELLCYNCYFLYYGSILNEQDIKSLESDLDVYKTTEDSNFKLDDYYVKRMQELGLYDSEEDEDDIYSIVPKK